MIPRRRQAFTLLEMLTVIVIIVMLVGILAPMVNKAYQKSRILEAQRIAKDIKTAIDAYQVEYGRLPSTSHNADVTLTTTSQVNSIVASLTASSSTNLYANIPNPKKIRFLTAAGVSTNNMLLDPWGKEYYIVLDSNYDGNILISGVATGRVNAIVRSYGPNRVANTASQSAYDDILSYSSGN